MNTHTHTVQCLLTREVIPPEREGGRERRVNRNNNKLFFKIKLHPLRDFQEYIRQCKVLLFHLVYEFRLHIRSQSE